MDEAYSPGSSNSSGGGLGPTPAVIAPPATANLRSKMEELNRQIEEQKQQIMKMAQADSSVTGEVCSFGFCFHFNIAKYFISCATY